MDKESEIFTKYWTLAMPSVAGFIHSMVNDYHEVQDILQDVAVVLHKKFDQYDPDKSFVSWSIGIARYEILHYRRSKARNVISYNTEIVDKIMEAYVKLEPEFSDSFYVLRECLSELRGKAKKAVELRYAQHLPSQDIAKSMNVSDGSVRVLLNRSRNTLKKCIKRKTT